MTTESTGPAEQRRGSRPGRRAVIMGVVGSMLVVAVALGVRWWRTPGLFYPVPGTVSTGRNQLPGEPNSWGMSYVRGDVDDSKSVSVVTARPNVLINTAEATISIRVCTPNLERAGAIGSVSDLRGWCTRLVSADGATMHLAKPTDQLVMTVTPNRPGTVLVKGLHVSYSYDWKRSSQDIGEFVRLRAH